MSTKESTLQYTYLLFMSEIFIFNYLFCSWHTCSPADVTIGFEMSSYSIDEDQDLVLCIVFAGVTDTSVWISVSTSSGTASGTL